MEPQSRRCIKEGTQSVTRLSSLSKIIPKELEFADRLPVVAISEFLIGPKLARYVGSPTGSVRSVAIADAVRCINMQVVINVLTNESDTAITE